MTKIPVERKRGGTAWWVWVIIALAIAALLWLLFSLFDNDPDGVAPVVPGLEGSPTAGMNGNTPNASPVPGRAAGGFPGTGWAIVDPVIILDAPDRPALVGQRVQLEAVPVQSVTGDKTFWVGRNNDRQLFVFLEEQATPADTDAALDINPGQRVRMSGVIRAMPPIAEAQQQWNLTDEQAAPLESQQIYLRADQVAIVEAAADAAASTAPGTTASNNPAVSAAPTGNGTAAEPLFDMLAIVNTPAQAPLIGRPVVFQNVRVQSVPGDRAFWVGPSAGQQVLVVLDEVGTPGTPTEGRYDINPGQDITIFGQVRPFPGATAAQQNWGVANDALLGQQQVYIHADRIEIISR